MESIIIGISGPAGSGKSTVANYLCDNYFASKISFAEPIRKMLYPIIDLLKYDQDESEVAKVLQEFKEDRIEELGASPRLLMQEIGGLFREINPDTFVNLAEKRIEMVNGINELLTQLFNSKGEIPSYAYIIDDVRYDNEANWITNTKKGTIVRVERPEHLAKKVRDHHSERGINRDYVSYEYKNEDEEMKRVAEIAQDIALRHGLTPLPAEVEKKGKIIMAMENTNVH